MGIRRGGEKTDCGKEPGSGEVPGRGMAGVHFCAYRFRPVSDPSCFALHLYATLI